MKRYRQLHLWIGLLTSVLILIEAVTGLILAEPWLVGAGKPQAEQHLRLGRTKPAGLPGQELTELKKTVDGGATQSGSSLLGFVRALHAGRVGNTDFSIILSVVAIGLIILTITGIILSIKALKLKN